MLNFLVWALLCVFLGLRLVAAPHFICVWSGRIKIRYYCTTTYVRKYIVVCTTFCLIEKEAKWDTYCFNVHTCITI